MERYGLFFCIVIAALVDVSVGQPGSWVNASVTDKEVIKAAKFAAEELNSEFDTIYHHRLMKIHRAETQVVSGVNYRVHIEFVPTTCKKSEVPFEEVEKCAAAVNGVNRFCKAVVWIQIWIPSTQLTEYECYRKS
ncbi:L-cystatin-like [Tachypleus tridentatus]|uniref:L-cystatin-like n=1 Tax=Tachypleus tridentatus TaxID=6853 RepID=UPI003FD6BD51